MKKLLLASTALVLSAGVAAADVKVGGDARMGILNNFNDEELRFNSRIRISFAASGETDGGLTFGGSIRADNAGGIVLDDVNNDGVLDIPEEVFPGGGAAGVAGSVFVSGAFGRLTMGDVAGAPEAAVGDLSGVGLTGLGDLNEATYLSNGGFGARSAARYDYTTGGFGFHISGDNPSNQFAPDYSSAYGVAVTFAADTYRVGLGYEDNGDLQHIILGGSTTFAGLGIKALYGSLSGDVSGDQWGISLDYVIDALTLTGYYMDKSDDMPGSSGYGIGAAYSLGGGATLRGGYAYRDSDDADAFDFGIAMTF